jgi:hypothetical protein
VNFIRATNAQAYLSARTDAIRKKAVSFERGQGTVNCEQRKPSAKKRSAVSQEKSFEFRVSGFEEENSWPAVVNLVVVFSG